MAPKADSKSKAAARPKAARPKKPALNKARALQQITSLSEDDDERAAISKKISWILRTNSNGAERIGISPYTRDGADWYKLEDIMAAEILDDVTDPSEDKYMSIIKESNALKLRYEIKNETGTGILLRALKKEERKKTEADEPTPAPWKPAEASKASQPEKSQGLRGDAPAFMPQAATQAAAMQYPSAMQYPYSYPAGYPYGASYPWPYGFAGMMGQMPSTTPATASAEQRFNGTIKSFNSDKGYGFIESAEAYHFYRRDVFLHKAMIGNLSVGQNVSFTVEANKEGMPQARDIKAAGGSSGGKGKSSKGKGKGKKGEKGDKGDKDKEDKREKGEGEGKGKKKKERKPKKGESTEQGESKEESKEPGKETSEEPAPASTEATSA